MNIRYNMLNIPNLLKYNVVFVLVTYDDGMNMYILANVCYNIFSKNK